MNENELRERRIRQLVGSVAGDGSKCGEATVAILALFREAQQESAGERAEKPTWQVLELRGVVDRLRRRTAEEAGGCGGELFGGVLCNGVSAVCPACSLERVPEMEQVAERVVSRWVEDWADGPVGMYVAAPALDDLAHQFALALALAAVAPLPPVEKQSQGDAWLTPGTPENASHLRWIIRESEKARHAQCEEVRRTRGAVAKAITDLDSDCPPAIGRISDALRTAFGFPAYPAEVVAAPSRPAVDAREVLEARRALRALFIEVPEAVARDITSRVEAAFAALQAQTKEGAWMFDALAEESALAAQPQEQSHE
jgi:hypothetical protein